MSCLNWKEHGRMMPSELIEMNGLQQKATLCKHGHYYENQTPGCQPPLRQGFSRHGLAPLRLRISAQTWFLAVTPASMQAEVVAVIRM